MPSTFTIEPAGNNDGPDHQGTDWGLVSFIIFAAIVFAVLVISVARHFRHRVKKRVERAGL